MPDSDLEIQVAALRQEVTDLKTQLTGFLSLAHEAFTGAVEGEERVEQLNLSSHQIVVLIFRTLTFLRDEINGLHQKEGDRQDQVASISEMTKLLENHVARLQRDHDTFDQRLREALRMFEQRLDPFIRAILVQILADLPPTR